jgi:trk system potassium uptake protein TrkA
MPRIVVFGLGRFGMSCARNLYDQGAEVLAIDRNRALVEEIKDSVTAAVGCDATVRSNLEAHDVGKMDAAVVAVASNFEASVLITVHCRELGVAKVVAKANNPLQRQILHQVGATEVVMPEDEMGARLADHVLRESVIDFVELPDGYSLRRVDVPQEWIGSTLADLHLLSERRLNIVQILRTRPVKKKEAEGRSAGGGDDEDAAEVEVEVEKIPLPFGEATLEEGDRIDVIGPDEALDRLASS